jgi:hypothetical protein
MGSTSYFELSTYVEKRFGPFDVYGYSILILIEKGSSVINHDF